jgi:archaemetzincin
MKNTIQFLLIFLLLSGCRGKEKKAAEKKALSTAAKTKKQPAILLQPLEKFSAADLAYLQTTIAGFYKAQVRIAPLQKIPAAFTTTIKVKRYRADSILRWLKNNQPGGTNFTVGLTVKDISTTSYDDKGQIEKPINRYTDWGVFGLGYMPGPACVISNFRLQSGASEKWRERLAKVVLHELGHNMGLPHCPNHCFMRDAVEKLSSVDEEPMALCTGCRQKLGLD